MFQRLGGGGGGLIINRFICTGVGCKYYKNMHSNIDGTAKCKSCMEIWAGGLTLHRDEKKSFYLKPIWIRINIKWGLIDQPIITRII